MHVINLFSLEFFDITFYEKDENVKKEKFKVFLEDNVPYFFKKLEDIAKANNGHLALGKVIHKQCYSLQT